MVVKYFFFGNVWGYFVKNVFFLRKLIVVIGFMIKIDFVKIDNLMVIIFILLGLNLDVRVGVMSVRGRGGVYYVM